jgi:hypothetical protein
MQATISGMNDSLISVPGLTGCERRAVRRRPRGVEHVLHADDDLAAQGDYCWTGGSASVTGRRFGARPQPDGEGLHLLAELPLILHRR